MINNLATNKSKIIYRKINLAKKLKTEYLLIQKITRFF